MERHIQHHFKLLQNIADGLQQHHNVRVHDLQVRLYLDEEVVKVMDVPTALDYLANDTHWDESGNWSEASRAVVDVM